MSDQTPIVRRVTAGAALRWITEGAALFRRAPREWIMLIAAVFLIMKLTLVIHPILGLAAVLVAPNFMAGLMHGCEALSRGQPLRMGYLISGFLKSGGPLVAVGGLSLLGQFATALLIYGLGGEEMKLVASLGPKALADPANAAAVQEAMPRIAGAFLVGTLVSIPFLLATWFAPLLVFFDERKPLAAMLLSFRACVRNLGAFVLLGALLIAGLILLMPLGMLTGELDLGLWLMAPILVPAIYVSYKDLFRPAPAAPVEPRTDV